MLVMVLLMALKRVSLLLVYALCSGPRAHVTKRRAIANGRAIARMYPLVEIDEDKPDKFLVFCSCIPLNVLLKARYFAEQHLA